MISIENFWFEKVFFYRIAVKKVRDNHEKIFWIFYLVKIFG